MKTLTNYFAFLDRRIQFAETPKLSAALSLLKDMKYYRRARQYLGDAFCFYLPETLQKPLRRFL